MTSSAGGSQAKIQDLPFERMCSISDVELLILIFRINMASVIIWGGEILDELGNTCVFIALFVSLQN